MNKFIKNENEIKGCYTKLKLMKSVVEEGSYGR